MKFHSGGSRCERGAGELGFLVGRALEPVVSGFVVVEPADLTTGTASDAVVFQVEMSSLVLAFGFFQVDWGFALLTDQHDFLLEFWQKTVATTQDDSNLSSFPY